MDEPAVAKPVALVEDNAAERHAADHEGGVIAANGRAYRRTGRASIDLDLGRQHTDRAGTPVDYRGRVLTRVPPPVPRSSNSLTLPLELPFNDVVPNCAPVTVKVTLGFSDPP